MSKNFLFEPQIPQRQIIIYFVSLHKFMRVGANPCVRPFGMTHRSSPTINPQRSLVF